MATIQNLKEIVKLGAGIYKVYGAAKVDGKIDIKDLGLLLNLLPDIEPAFSGISQLPAEAKDLDAAEAQELATYLVSELGVLPEKTTEIINASLGFLISGYKLYSAFKA